jgi:hypothetical protein
MPPGYIPKFVFFSSRFRVICGPGESITVNTFNIPGLCSDGNIHARENVHIY